jgi:predicted NAD-dependent protein-ADP-ribosyltransferase YbiA (DUF1768 family)
MTPFAVKNPRLMVTAGRRGTNQAVIRTDADGNVYPNSFGIIVKKFSDLPSGGYARQEGCFVDTDEDFEYFKQLNEHMFNRLVTNKPIIFPAAIAKGKAALPLRFAEWLQQQLLERFDIRSNINVNTNPGYSGYGLDLVGFADTGTNSNNSTEKINIYAGTGENADLSNFAERPLNFGKTTAYSIPEGATSGAFKSKYPIYDIGKVTYSTKENPDYGESFVFDGLSDLFSGRRFKTVEGAFQAAKLVFTHPKGNGAKGNKYWQPKEYTQRENSVDGVYYNTATTFVLTDEGEQLLQKFQEASGTQARSLGRQIEGLNRQEWDANSSKIMKAVIGRSFEDNQQALQRLLATGNATLTHTQDKGKWGTEFPKLLMEVRDELRKEHPQV